MKGRGERGVRFVSLEQTSESGQGGLGWLDPG